MTQPPFISHSKKAQKLPACDDNLALYCCGGRGKGTEMERAVDPPGCGIAIADINICPGYGLSSLGKLLKMMSEEEMAELIKAGERGTWPKVPTISTTTQIGRALDGILHAFEIDEAHWLRTAPQTNTALDSEIRRSGKGRGPAKAKRSKRVSKIIRHKAQDRSAA